MGKQGTCVRRAMEEIGGVGASLNYMARRRQEKKRRGRGEGKEHTRTQMDAEGGGSIGPLEVNVEGKCTLVAGSCRKSC